MPTEEEAKKILNEILKMMAENTLKTSDLDELKESLVKSPKIFRVDNGMII